jgi:outer membrane protein assembly factor BamB
MTLRRNEWFALWNVVVLVSSILFVACEPSSQQEQPTSVPLLQAHTADVKSTPLERLTIYISDSNAIYALRANDGKERWHRTTRDKENNSPQENERPSSFIQVGGVLFYTGSSSVNAVRTNDGSLLWKHSGQVSSFLATPSLLVYGSSNASNQERGEISTLRASDGHLLWKHTTQWQADPLLVTPSLVIYRTQVLGRCITYGVQASDGKELWQKDTCGNNITEANGILYVQDDTRLLAWSSSSGKQLWNVNLDNSSQTAPSLPPVVVNQMIYQPMARNVFAVRASDGKLLWKFPIEFATVALGGKQTFVMSGNRLYALQADTGRKQWDAIVGDARGVRWLQTEKDKVYVWTLVQNSDDLHFFHVLRTQDGKQLWQVPMIASAFGTPPVLVQGIAYIGDGRELFHAIRVQDGKELWHFPVRGVYNKPFLLEA